MKVDYGPPWMYLLLMIVGGGLAVFVNSVRPYPVASEYNVGNCITLDAPKWINDLPRYKILQKDGSSYQVLALDGDEAGYIATLRNTIANEFHVTFRDSRNVEIEKLFLKMRVIDCPQN